MATTLELKDRLRRDLEDTVAPYLWSDDELMEYINEAMDEACIRAGMIRDSDSEVCEFVLRANQSKYDIDDRILRIKRVMIDGQKEPLEETNFDDLDTDYPGWHAETANMPRRYLSNMDACWIRLHPIPLDTASKKVRLVVQRLQLKPLTLDKPDSRPEINKIYHFHLLEWAKYLAYSKPDAETLYPEGAERAGALFVEHFGNRDSAADIEVQQNFKRQRTRGHYI